MNKDFMNVKEFANEIKVRLEDMYPGTEFNVAEVTKNNDEIMIGLSVKNSANDYTPQVYINDFYEKFKSGNKTIEEIALIVQQVFDSQNSEPWTVINVNTLREWETLKSKLIIKLVGLENNKEYLKDAIYKRVCDNLVAVVFILFDIREDGVITSKLTKEQFESLDIPMSEVIETAINNTEKIFPVKIKKMSELLSEQMGCDIFSLPPEEDIMYVMSNSIMVNGASTVLYKNALRDFCVEHGLDRVIILPSSIHETILVFPNTMMEDKELKCLVTEVNEEVVKNQDVLSNDVYVYTVEDDEIHIL